MRVSQLAVLTSPAAAATSGMEAMQGLASSFHHALRQHQHGRPHMGASAGGMAFIFTDGDKVAAGTLWGPMVGGEDVITPKPTRGDRHVHCFGKAATN